MRAFLRTFGCRANHYDAEVTRATLEAGGAAISDDPGAADVAVFTSCAVTSDAVADLRQGVRAAVRAQPSLRVIIAGCATGGDVAREVASLPNVLAVIPGADHAAVAAAAGLSMTPARPARQDGARALLRVQDGCDEHCTFCFTTLARGANRSRGADEIVAEAHALAAHHAEIVITGTHIGTYGRDIGTSLGALLQRLVADVPNVRFRLSSIEATEVDDTLRDLLRRDPRRLAPFLHAPLQSGSDRVLRRMGRHWYTADAYARAIERIVDGVAVFGLAADVITGFPGERDEDHAATVALVERLPFTALHVFPYSPRPGTSAPRLDGAVPEWIARERAAELRALARRKGETYRAWRTGGPADVVVVGSAERRYGVTEDYLTVGVPAGAPRGTRFTGTVIPA